MKETSKVRKIALVGDSLPLKCGNATFTADLHSPSQCLAVSVNVGIYGRPAGGHILPEPIVTRL